MNLLAALIISLSSSLTIVIIIVVLCVLWVALCCRPCLVLSSDWCVARLHQTAHNIDCNHLKNNETIFIYLSHLFRLLQMGRALRVCVRVRVCAMHGNDVVDDGVINSHKKCENNINPTQTFSSLHSTRAFSPPIPTYYSRYFAVFEFPPAFDRNFIRFLYAIRV